MNCTLIILDPTLKFFLEQDRFDSYTQFVKSIKSNLAKKMYIPLKGELKKIEPTENGFLIDNFEVKGNELVSIIVSGVLDSNDPQNHFESFLDSLVKLVEKYESDQSIPTEEKNDDRDFLNSLVPFFNNYPVEDSFKESPVYQTFRDIRERINSLFNQIEEELDLNSLEEDIRTDESFQQDVQQQAPYEYTITYLYETSTDEVLNTKGDLSLLKHNVSQEVENQIEKGERFAIRFEKDNATNVQSIENISDLPNFQWGVVGVLYRWENEWKRVYVESFENSYNGKVKLTTDPNKGTSIGANKQKGFTVTLPDFKNTRYSKVNDVVRQVLISYRDKVNQTSNPSSFLEIKGTISDYPKATAKSPYQKRVITAKTFLQGKPNKLVLASKDDKVNYAGNLYLDYNGAKVPLDRKPLSENWRNRVYSLVNHTYTQEEAERVVKFLNALLDFNGGDIKFSLRGNKIKAQRKSIVTEIDGVKVFGRIEPTDIDENELLEVLEYARINVHKDWVGQTILTPIIFKGELREANTNFEDFYLEHHQTVFRQIKIGDQLVFGPVKSLLFDVKYESPELTRDKEFQENPKIGNLEISQDEVIPLEKITNELLNMSNKVQGDLKDVLVVLNALVEKPEVKKKLEGATIKFVTTYSKDFKGMADDKEVLINFALINNPANYEIIAHEIVHVLTVDWISKNPDHELTQQLNELVKQVPDSVVEIIEKAGYKKEDPRFIYEVLARLTDPNVVKELKKVKSKNKTLFEKLKEVVKDILSLVFDLKKSPTLYADFLESLVSISLEPTTPKKGRDRFKMDTKPLSLGYDENSLKEFLNQGFSETYLNQAVKRIDAGLSQFIFDQGLLPQLLQGQLGFENVFAHYNNFVAEYLDTNEDNLSKEEVDYLDNFFLSNNEFLRDYWIENTTLVRVRKQKKGEKTKALEISDDLENDPNEVEENENPEKEQDIANTTGGEAENKKVRDFDTSGVKESSLESADPISRAFVKLIPKIEKVNGVTKIYSDEERLKLIDNGTRSSYFTKVPSGWIKFKTDSTGSLELNDYTETWNLIANLFANKMTIEEMLDSISESALDIVPEVFVLKERLNVTNPNDWDVDLNLRIETAFKKATVDTYVMIKSETGRFYFVNESKDIQSNGKKKIDSNFLRKVNDEFLEFYDRETDKLDIRKLFTHLGILKNGKIDLGNKLLVELLGLGFHPKTLRENGIVTQEVLELESYLGELLLNLGHVSVSISESIFSGGIVDKKKFEGLSGIMKKVLLREDSIRPLSTTTMVKNAEGENQSTLSQLNAILQYRNLLNKANSKEELLEEYERLKNPMFNYSLTNQILFPQVVDETLNTLVDSKSNVKVEVELLNGYKEEQKGRASEGKLTIDLDDASWLRLNFIGMIKHGIIENTRAETASTSYFFRLSNWQPNVPGGSHTPLTFSDISPEFKRETNEFDISVESKLYKVWENYLKGELERMSLQSKTKDKVKWGLFDSILNSNEKEILLKSLDQSTLKNALNRFFTEQYNEYDKLFEKTMGGVNALVGEYATSTSKDVYGDKALWDRIRGQENAWKAFYVVNSMILHTEEAILFQGDLSQTPKYYKRAKGVQSTGTPLSLSKSAVESTNKRLRENSFGQVFGYPLQIGKTYKSSVLKDDIKPSAYKDNFFKGFVESQKLYYKELGITKTEEDIIKDANKLLFPKGEGYNAVNIGDGGGVSSPDFHWAMLKHVGNISLEQQQVYDALVLDAKAHAKDYLGEGFVNTPLTQEEKEKVKLGFELMAQGKGQFPLVKFTHRNTMVGSNDVVKPEMMDKFALFPLFPQFVQDKPVAKALLISMMKSGTGYVKFESGTKIDQPSSVDFISMVERGELEIELPTHELKTDFLREQIKTPNKHKEKNTFGSQVRKNILAELGKVKLSRESFKGEFKLEWEKLNQDFSLEVKKEVLGKLGIEETDNGWDFTKVDKAKVAQILYDESVQRDLPLNLKTYFDKYKRGVLDPESFYNYFEASMGAQQIQNLLASIIKKISVQKLKGSQYRQVPSSLFDRNIKSNGKTRELGFYKYDTETNTVLAAECKIGMGGSFLNLLNLEEIDDYLNAKPEWEDNILTRLKILNIKLQNDSWVEKHKDVLTIAAYRIPNQGHNSDEVFIIREFLPPFHAGEIILPPEVTTQSGTDYDYDKMSAIVPSIGKNGRLITKGSKGIQNEMIKTISKILLDPVNYHKLIVPNSNHIIFDFLKKDLLLKLYPDLKFDKMSPTEVITLKRNLRQFVSVQGKNLLGIAAVWNPFTVLVQNHGIEVQDFYKKKIGFGRKAVILEVPVNPLMGSKESSTLTQDGLNKLEVISQLINVTVDMPSDDTFGMTGFVREDFAAFIYSMSMLNYGFEDSMNLFHQPIVFKYKAMVKDLMRKGVKRYKANIEVLSALLDIPLVETDSGINYTKSEVEIFKKLTELEQGFDKSKFNVLSIEEALSKDKFSDSQKAFLAHYVKLVDQSGQVRTVQSALNFDTSPDNNLAKAKDRIKNYKEAKEAGIIPPKKIDEIQYNSVISGLYATDILENLTTSLFPILYSEENKTLFDEIRESFVQFSEQAFRKASNDFLLAILQNYGKINNRSLINIATLYIEGSKKADIIRGARETQKKLLEEGKNYRLLDILVANVSKPNKKKRINPQLIMGMENSAADKDQLTEEFRELLNHPDDKVKNFATVLAVTGLIQSGWSKSPLYFSDVIPEEFITPIIRESLREYERTSNLEKAAFRSQFEKNFNYYEGKSLGRKSTNTTSYHEDSYRLMDYTRGVEEEIEKFKEENVKTSKTPEFDNLPSKSKTKTFTYAGVGSRKTPPEVLEQMTQVAKELELKGYTLRSGGAQGADTAFEKGTTKKEIFYAKDATDQTRKIAKEIHEKPEALSGTPLDLMARNTNQVFGKNLNVPVDFVLAWTPLNAKGEVVTKANQRYYGGKTDPQNTGGTGQAIALASLKGIPVINMADPNWRSQLDKVLSGSLVEDISYEDVAVKPLESIGKLPMQPDNISKILSGQKTITNRSDLFEDGVYELPNGVEVNLEYIGEWKVFNDGTPRIYQIDEIGSKLRSMLKNEFAQAEGFKDWKDFEQNNKFSNKFIKGDESRYVYSIIPIKQPIQEQIQQSNTEGFKIVIPTGSNPNNTEIFRNEDTIYLMNDAQQRAYNEIKKFLVKRLSDKSFNDEVVSFEEPLAKEFSDIIPKAMWDNMIGLIGKGGTGKTTLINKILKDVQEDLLKQNPYNYINIRYVAPTHNAVTILQESLGYDSERTSKTVSTAAAFVYRNQQPGSDKAIKGKPGDELLLLNSESYEEMLEKGFITPITSEDIIVVDESSMIDKEFIQDVLLRMESEWKQRGRKMPIFIFMGDYRQLPPVTTNSDRTFREGIISATLFSDLNSDKHFELKQVMRSKDELFHKIFDSIGDQINNQRKEFNSNRPVSNFDFSKYDAVSNKSSENLLIAGEKQVEQLLDTYAQELVNNDNPYKMFWVHYNKLTHPKTQELFQRIRKKYFEKLGKKVESELIQEGDYIQYAGSLPLQTITNSDKGISSGEIKPTARLKVLEYRKASEIQLQTLSNVLASYVGNLILSGEYIIVLNRQDKKRYVHSLEHGAIKIGNYDANSKTQEVIVKDITGKEHSVKIPYRQFKEVQPVIQNLTRSLNTLFKPSYIGSSHTVQGASIETVIVGDYNIRQNAPNIALRDMESSLYTSLTRASKKLIIIKPDSIKIENNQQEFSLKTTVENTTSETNQEQTSGQQSLFGYDTQSLNEEKSKICTNI